MYKFITDRPALAIVSPERKIIALNARAAVLERPEEFPWAGAVDDEVIRWGGPGGRWTKRLPSGEVGRGGGGQRGHQVRHHWSGRGPWWRRDHLTVKSSWSWHCTGSPDKTDGMSCSFKIHIFKFNYMFWSKIKHYPSIHCSNSRMSNYMAVAVLALAFFGILFGLWWFNDMNVEVCLDF